MWNILTRDWVLPQEPCLSMNTSGKRAKTRYETQIVITEYKAREAKLVEMY